VLVNRQGAQGFTNEEKMLVRELFGANGAGVSEDAAFKKRMMEAEKRRLEGVLQAEGRGEEAIKAKIEELIREIEAKIQDIQSSSNTLRLSKDSSVKKSKSKLLRSNRDQSFSGRNQNRLGFSQTARAGTMLNFDGQ
jgi:hypothetical protein